VVARTLWLMFVILLMVALVLAVLLSSQQLASLPSKGEEGASNEQTEQEAQKDAGADDEAIVVPEEYQQPGNEASKDRVGWGRLLGPRSTTNNRCTGSHHTNSRTTTVNRRTED
jgi:hypothetical protein